MTHQSAAGRITSTWPGATILREPPIALAFVPMLVALWSITHLYQGFSRDGELYAVQALARINPQLATDLYLQNTSQDRFTVFSPLYAMLIRMLGLQRAELTLFIVCSVGFLAAIWQAARKLWNESTAWLTVALFISTVGYYGAYRIFAYSENYLTARSMSEALVVGALACHISGRRVSALLVALSAAAIHPLMAFPGVVLLVCLRLSTRNAALLLAAGTLAALAIAAAATIWPGAFPAFEVMNPAWLEVVRERSQFLFLKYWAGLDWEVAARPFVCLTLAALVTSKAMVRKLCITGMLVGAAGLAVSYIACTVGPLSLLLQGQAWRWEWVTGCLAVFVAVPTALEAWREPRVGPLCAMLLISGWTSTEADFLMCIDAALLLWLVKGRVTAQVSRLLLGAAAILIAIIVTAIIANAYKAWGSPLLETNREAAPIARIRDTFGIGITAVVLVVPCWLWLKDGKPLRTYAAAAAFFAAAALVFPGSVKQLASVGTAREIDEFSDWRAKVPPDSTVLMVPTGKTASFAWFTLNRPNYLSVDQSAGVVFSAATAEEVRRRAEVLRPIADPDWQILTHILETRAGTRKQAPPDVKLTADALVKICGDPKLGFVIYSQNIGFQPLTHRVRGTWNNWNLYDCREVLADAPHA